MKDNELILAGMDLEDLMGRLLGNAALIPIFIKKFIADENYGKLTAAIAAGDDKAAEMASHTLKGMCGNLSLKELFGLFGRQVDLLRAGDSAAAAAMMGEIAPRFEKTIGHMRRYLEQ